MRKFKVFCDLFYIAALVKHKIRIKFEKCKANVLYFVVCFAKNNRKMRKVYSRSYNFYMGLNWQVGIHFSQNITKNTEYI